MGFPVVMLFIYVIVPLYKTLPQPKQALIGAFIPSVALIPKIVTRVFAQRLEGINHPGTSGMLLIALYAGAPLIFRTLQAELHSLSWFTVLFMVW